MNIVELDERRFDEYASSHEFANPWQTSAYAKSISKLGYAYQFIGIEKNNNIIGVCLLLYKTVYMGFKHCYAPRGPLVDYKDLALVSETIKAIQKYVTRNKCLAFTFDPFITKCERDAKGNILFTNHNAEEIINTIKGSNIEYIGNNLYFEAIQPRWYSMLKLPVNPQKLFGRINKQARNKLRKSAKYGVEIFQDESTNVEEFYNLLKDHSNKPIEYYQELKNHFQDNCEIFYARINTEKYVNNSKFLYEKEVERNDKLNQIIQNDGYKGKNMRTILNQKMESDKVISSYKNHLITSTELLRDYPEGLTIAAALVLKNSSGIFIFEECFDKRYGSLCPLHLLRWKLIEKFSGLEKHTLCLNAITGEFDKSKNQYKGLNEVRLAYNAIARELIGEFSVVTNKLMFEMYKDDRVKPFV